MSFKILFAEDDEDKAGHVKATIRRNLSGVEVEVVRSVQSAAKTIRTGKAIDLLLLDMSLNTFDVGPSEDGWKPQRFGGLEVLRQMKRFKRDIPCIVITQFETFGEGRNAINLAQLDEKLSEQHSEVYFGLVYYNAAISGWEQALLEKIRAIPGGGE